jgi:hypothetical protein
VTSGQGARKRRKYIYFDQLLPIMQQRETSGNITPLPSANESEPQDITTGNEMGEGSRAKNATYCRQQKKRSKTTDEESLLEIIKGKSRDDIDEDKSFLMSLVPSFKKLNDEYKFVAKVEFLNVMRRITFCQPPIMSVVHLSLSLILTCLGHLHILHILEPSPVLKFLPEHITKFLMTSNINTISPFKILIPNSRLAHSTLLLPTAVPPLHICRPLMETVCHL